MMREFLVCMNFPVLTAFQLCAEDPKAKKVAEDPIDRIFSPNANESPEGLFKIVPDARGSAYFPKGREVYYTQYLAAMKEPSLLSPGKGAPAVQFRFTWLRSFHEPMAVRVWSDGKVHQVRAVQMPYRRDGKVGPITTEVSRKLTDEEWQQVSKLFAHPDFWKPETDPDFEPFKDGGLDGAQWIFEKSEGARYALMDVWSPKYPKPTPAELKQAGIDPATKLRDLKIYQDAGEYLLKITGMMPSESVY